MKTNILKTITCGALVMAATGCKEEKAAETSATQQSPRQALVAALETQANGLMNSFNNVIVDSEFIKNLNLQNPPEKVSVQTEDDVKKALNYLLAQEKSANGATVYTPDKRICSEVLAKDNPATCEDIFSRMTLAQVEQDATSGLVQVYLENIKAFGFVYTPEIVSLNVSLPELLETLKKVDEIKVAHNEESMNLPTTAQGNVALTLAQKMGATIADVTVNQKVRIIGVDRDSQNYDYAIESGQNAVTASFYPNMGIAALSVQLPQAVLTFPVHDHDNIYHSMQLVFPGGQGVATLNNAMSMIDFSGVQLAAPTVTAKADGQAMAQLTVNGQVNAQVTSYAGGHIGLKFLSPVSGQLQTVSNPLFSEQGTITASITQGTEVYFAKDAQQAKVISGSFTYVGTQDFIANMTATAGMCIEGDENQSLYLQTAVCK